LQRGGQKTFQHSDKPYKNTNEFLDNDRVIESSDKCQKLRQEWQSAIRHSYWINKLKTTDRDTIWKTISKKQTHKKPTLPISGLVGFQPKANALQDGHFPDSAEPPDIPDNFCWNLE
jgi:hypothetical protein